MNELERKRQRKAEEEYRRKNRKVLAEKEKLRRTRKKLSDMSSTEQIRYIKNRPNLIHLFNKYGISLPILPIEDDIVSYAATFGTETDNSVPIFIESKLNPLNFSMNIIPTQPISLGNAGELPEYDSNDENKSIEDEQYSIGMLPRGSLFTEEPILDFPRNSPSETNFQLFDNEFQFRSPLYFSDNDQEFLFSSPSR